MANWRTDLRELSRRLPRGGSEAEALQHAVFEAESDHGCALIAGSMTENALEGIILAYLVSLSKARQSELFGVEGVLSSFSAKIKVAFAFGLIDENLRDRFDKVREIRNAFAHSKIAINFSTPEVSRACGQLTSDKFVLSMKPRVIY